jgi:ATP-dependent DNA helicase RecG
MGDCEQTRAGADTVARRGVASLSGAGPRIAERLAVLGIHTVADLLFHLPSRYQDRTRITPMGSARAGEEVLVQGEVKSARVVFGRRRSLVCSIGDGSGMLGLRFFHFNASQQAGLKPGSAIRCFGELRRGSGGLELVHPEYRVFHGDDPEPLADRLTPVYATTEGIGQNLLRRFMDQALSGLAAGAVEELLPAELLRRFDVPPLAQALSMVHRPTPDVSLQRLNEEGHPAVMRLAFEELIAHQAALKRLRRSLDRDSAAVIPGPGALAERFLRALPFDLTAAQQRVHEEIRRDLARASPMHRLVQGDVGSGKTVVAALAALDTVEAGMQAAVMAPTELLAEQHLRNFVDWLEPLGIGVAWLTGTQGTAQRRETLSRLADGRAQVVVGTHALFQEHVHFHALALIVVDEQHRFGVEQRLSLRNKGRGEHGVPHQLIMTATPIPRTLAMAAYADLDTSVIDELPPGRLPVDTVVVSDQRRAQVVERVHAACREGQQAYWVCTLIDDSEALEAQAAEETRAELAAALEDLHIGLVHGRMKSADKDATMQRFKAGEIQLLVATTVIEVGVDVPNASLMIIDNAERLGLSQLHQLRGRVGRGARKSACVLLYRPPLGDSARARLETMRSTSDGFQVAQADLELRGPGEILGTRQTGLARMRIADIIRDRALLPAAASAADQLLDLHPHRADALIARWVGEDTDYGRI